MVREKLSKECVRVAPVASSLAPCRCVTTRPGAKSYALALEPQEFQEATSHGERDLDHKRHDDHELQKSTLDGGKVPEEIGYSL